MRRLEFDQFEFEHPGSEESIVIMAEERTRTRRAALPNEASSPDLHVFLRRCEALRKPGDSGIPSPGDVARTPMQSLDECRDLRDYGGNVRAFSGLGEDELAHARVAWFHDERDFDSVGVIETPNWLLLYHWESSA